MLKLTTSEKVTLFCLKNLIWFINAGLFTLFSVLIPGFLSLRNLNFIFYLSSLMGFIVLGESFVILIGQMDLSLARLAGFSAMIVGYLSGILFMIPDWATILLLLLISASLGMVNGLLIYKLKLNSFLVTLSTYLIFSWGTYQIRDLPIVTIPTILTVLGRARIGGVYFASILFVLTVAIAYFILNHTRYGRRVYQVGGNPDAARMLGISIEKVGIIVFTVAGLLAGISGLLYIGYLNCITSTIGEGLIFMVFAAIFLGGVSLRGGVGSVTDVLGGIILLGIIDAAVTMMLVSPYMRGILSGVILLLAIIINKMKEQLIDRILTPR